MSVQELTDKLICPEWIVQSQAMLGRCIPSITEAGLNSSALDGKITWESLKTGVESLANLLGLRDIGVKVFDDLVKNWWTILIGLIISSVVAFLWIILMRYVPCVGKN